MLLLKTICCLPILFTCSSLVSKRNWLSVSKQTPCLGGMGSPAVLLSKSITVWICIHCKNISCEKDCGWLGALNRVIGWSGGIASFLIVPTENSCVRKCGGRVCMVLWGWATTSTQEEASQCQEAACYACQHCNGLNNSRYKSCKRRRRN